jgi:hypothetical protein
LFSAFGGFDRFPGVFHGGTITSYRIAKHMGMAANQFFTDAFRNIAQIEPLVFLGDLGMEHHLQQEISQFFFEVSVVAMTNRICDFVGLL